MRLEFHGSKISSDSGLLLFRERDEVLGLHDIAGGLLRDTRTGHDRLHSLVGLLRQSVFGRLAGYDDVNDADRLALDPVMRQVVGGRAVDAQAASASQMGRFETETLALSENRTALADWSLISLQLKLIKIGARVVRHARAITFQLAEMAVTGPMVRAVLAAIRRLRAPPSCA